MHTLWNLVIAGCQEHDFQVAQTLGSWTTPQHLRGVWTIHCGTGDQSTPWPATACNARNGVRHEAKPAQEIVGTSVLKSLDISVHVGSICLILFAYLQIRGSVCSSTYQFGVYINQVHRKAYSQMCKPWCVLVLVLAHSGLIIAAYSSNRLCSCACRPQGPSQWRDSQNVEAQV